MTRVRVKEEERQPVTIGSDKGSLRLIISRTVFDDNKQRYVTLGLRDTPRNRLKAQLRQAELILDIDEVDERVFDVTLEKYKAWKRELSGRRSAKEKPVTTERTEPAKITILGLWAGWCEYKKPLLGSSIYNMKYEGTYRRLLSRPSIADLELSHLSAQIVRDRLLDESNPTDISLLLAQLEQAAQRVITNGQHVGNNPFAGMSKTVARRIKSRKINDDEADDFFNSNSAAIAYTASERDTIIEAYRTSNRKCVKQFYPLVFAKFYTGMRWNEIAELRWKDINKDCSKIAIRRAYIEISDTVELPKNGTTRVFNCSPILQEFLTGIKPEFVNGEDLLFADRKGKRWKYGHFGLIWRGDDNKKGIVRSLFEDGCISFNLPPRNTRHTFVNIALESGVPQHIICAQVGHSIVTEDKSYRDNSITSDYVIKV